MGLGYGELFSDTGELEGYRVVGFQGFRALGCSGWRDLEIKGFRVLGC